MISDSFIRDLAWGPKRKVKTWPVYFVNGYKFHIESYSQNKSTSNSGVCIKGTDYGQSEIDFYGVLQEIIEIEYVGESKKQLVLFNCEWFDPTNRGTRIHEQSGIVEVHANRRYHKFDPFIFAQQAMQVYYAPFPAKRDKAEWRGVIKIKVRSTVEAKSVEVDYTAYQEDAHGEIHHLRETQEDELQTLQDINGCPEEVNISSISRQLNIDYDDEDVGEGDEEEEGDDDEEDLLDDEDTSTDDDNQLHEVYSGDDDE